MTKHGECLKKQSMSILEQSDLFLSYISQKLSVGFSLDALDALSTDLIIDFGKRIHKLSWIYTKLQIIIVKKLF